MTMIYPFSADHAITAYRLWRANCGPNALAFALQIPLSQVRGHIPGFEGKGYTNPTMMRAALTSLGKRFTNVRIPDRTSPGCLITEPMFNARPALVRVQWTGPWTKAGANPKWGYRMTHWITTWAERGVPLIFDCNRGICGFNEWETEVVPKILEACVKDADGGWFPTHIWRLQ